MPKIFPRIIESTLRSIVDKQEVLFFPFETFINHPGEYLTLKKKLTKKNILQNEAIR